MQKLDPRAVWSFFFQYFFVFIFLWIFLSFPAFSLAEIPVLNILGDVALVWGISALFSLVFIVLLSYVLASLTYRFWQYQLAKDAIKIEKGIIWKKYISIPYGRIQNVDIYRGVLARLLGLSDLQIQTAGYSSYKQYGRGSEGRLPGLNIQVAEQLRDELIKKVKGAEQGL